MSTANKRAYRKPTKREREQAQRIVSRYRQQINETPALLSILYDLDLLPEQITRPINAFRCAAFCMMISALTKAQLDGLFAHDTPPSNRKT